MERLVEPRARQAPLTAQFRGIDVMPDGEDDVGGVLLHREKPGHEIALERASLLHEGGEHPVPVLDRLFLREFRWHRTLLVRSFLQTWGMAAAVRPQTRTTTSQSRPSSAR